MIEDIDLYKSTLNYIPEGITIKDDNGIILFCNKAFCEQLGYHVLELINKPIKDLIASRFQEKYNKLMANQVNFDNKEIHFEKAMLTKGGQVIWFHAFSKIITSNDKNYRITFYRNEIDHKRQKELLLESPNKINEYSFLTSHKLRHPIANILGLINLIDVENLSNPENLHLIDYLKKTSSQLNEVVHELNTALNSSKFSDELRIFPKPQYPKMVMVIDDDSVNQFITTSIINRIEPKIKIKTFGKPKEAIQYFVDGNAIPDIILLDLDHLQMNEWDFLKNFEEVCENSVPIYLLKNFVTVKDRSISKQYRVFKDFLVKPITTEKLDEIFNLFEL
jgi:PAS domain S-box-containing protein